MPTKEQEWKEVDRIIVGRGFDGKIVVSRNSTSLMREIYGSHVLYENCVMKWERWNSR